MRCPSCENDEDRVVDSRSTREGAAIRRRRECLACGHRFTTYESVERVPVLVIKKDGRRVPYDRERIVDGLIQACQKRPISRDQMDLLVERVEGRIFAGARDEVTSHEIGECVMAELQELDEIAYVRFASVYRSFRDLNQFMDELRVLLDRQADGERSEES
jgi:transcriptional repressor NrdR